MAYTAPTLRSTGDLITASIWNTDIVNNIIAMFGGAMGIASQAANDLIYAASASQLARLAMGASSGMPLASVAAGAPVWGGDMDWIDALLKNAELKGFLETVPTLAIASNVLILDRKAGNVVKVPFGANITTTTLSNIPATGKACNFEIYLVANGSPFTWAWLTSTVVWDGGVAPSFVTTNNHVMRFVVSTIDGGTTWRGVPIAGNYAS
jgi:hypothetical protein